MAFEDIKEQFAEAEEIENALSQWPEKKKKEKK